MRFLIRALRHYIERGLPWLATLRADMWDNGVFLMLNALSNEHAVRLLRDNPSERSMLLALLPQVGEHTDDDDILEESRGLGAALSD